MKTEAAIRFAAAASLWGRPSPRGFLPRVDPRLVAVLVPSLHQPTPKRDDVAVSTFHGHRWTPEDGPPGPPDDGLVCSADFGTSPDFPRRYGGKGLSPLGSRRIHQGLSLCEEERACFAMWTVSLPDEALATLERLDTWWRFQTNLRHRLHLKLKRRGLQPEIVGVVEVHPGRSARARKTLPHLHIVYRGRRHRWEDWRVKTWEFDHMICQALKAAGHEQTRQVRGSQVERIKFSCKAYLRKYLSKPSRFGVFRIDWDTTIELIPRRWHILSRCLLLRVKAATCDVSAQWLAWLIDHREDQGPKGLYQADRVPIEDPRAPPAWSVVWRSPAALVQTLEAWEAAHGQWDGIGPTLGSPA